MFNLFLKNFNTQPFDYQISASYWLEHSLTGDRKRWVGSFFARDQAAASITGPVFLLYNSVTFCQSTERLLRLENIRNSLSRNFDDTKWHYNELISAILNFQTVLPINHSFLLRHSLLTQKGQKRKRRHVVLYPFTAAQVFVS